MRKHKLLFMFVAVLLCVSMLLTACGDETGNEPPAPDPTPDETPEEPRLPELLSYFVIDPTKSDYYVESKEFTTVEEIDGDVIWVETPDGTELMAAISDEVDHFNNDVIEVDLYRNGEVILTCTETYSLSDKVEKSVNMYFENGVLIFEVRTLDLEDYTVTYKRSYYQYSETEKPTKLYDGNDVVEYKVVGNLTVVVGEETVKWYGTSNNVVFEMSTDFYRANGFDEGYEYDGYLYFGSSNSLYIYNPDGTCVAEYHSPANSEDVHFAVLNNGNIVIQEELVVLDDSAEAVYNFVYDDTRYLVKTYIMDYKTGTLTEKADVDFIVVELESAKDAERYGTSFSFELVDGKQNQAIVWGFDKDGLDDNGQYVVIDNDLKIEYVFPIRTSNYDVYELAEDAFAISDKYFVTRLMSGTDEEDYVFDLYGNPISRINVEAVTDEFIFVYNAVCDLDLNVIYVMSDNGVYPDPNGLYDLGGKFLASTDTNYDEYYDEVVIDPVSGEVTVLANFIDAVLCDAGDSYYVLLEYCDACKAHYDECDLDDCEDDYCVFGLDCDEIECESCVHSLYSASGKLLFTTSSGCIDVETHNNSLVIYLESYNVATDEYEEYYFLVK